MSAAHPGMLARYPARRSLRWAIRLVVFALTMACALRVQLGNSYTMLLSDSLDGLIQTSLMQHWYNVFRGLEPWNAPAYFYPNKDTLGYNDGFFLHGVIYSVFRWSGCDPFLSAELAGQAIRAVGFFAFEVFAATVLGFGFGWALLGAVVFTLSNNLYVQAAHGQLMTVSFAPLLGWLLWRGLQALKAPSLGWFDRGATLCGCAAALLYGAWLLTGFYMAWFATFFVVLVVLATAVQDAAGRGAGWRAWRMLWERPVLPVGVVTLLAILPFLVVYLPKAQETGSHSFAEVMVYSPAPTDILHIGSGNLLFGAVDKAVTQALRPASDDYGEHTIGFPPLLALLATAGAVLAWARPRGPHPVLLRSLALATAVSFIALVHFGAHTLWYWVHAYFPGAKGVRVVARYAIFLAFPVILLAVDFLRSRALRWPAWVIALLVVVLVAEEIQLVDYSHLDRGAERQRLAAFPPPPASCRAFFVQSPVDRPSTGSPTVDSLYLSNVDAMMLAEVWAVPTVNGFATFNPPDWNFASVGESSYLARVGMYLDGRALHDGICGLDMAQHAWITDPHLPIPALKAGATVDLGQAGLGADQYLGRGWNPPDPTGRWGQGRWADGDQAALSFAVPNSPPGASLTLQLDATAYARPGRTPNPIAVDINGTAVTTWHPEAGAQVLSVTIPPELMRADNQVWLRLSVIPPRTWFGPPKSATRLGLFARSFRVVPATKASTDPP